ncbi:MAG: CRR6 family NdhI maturation factor [Cyanobacteria bacterium P01_C01_bin.121]
MKHAIALTTTHFQTLDLTPAQAVIDPILTNRTLNSVSGNVTTENDATNGLTDNLGSDLSNPQLTFSFDIDFPREASDPRELSEIPEVRLWFIRLNAKYPWLPLYLDWESGELSRYTAMLVPHQFSNLDGIRYNPEALEIFVMDKVFTLNAWLTQQGIDGRSRLKFMTQMLGYELDDALFDLLR